MGDKNPKKVQKKKQTDKVTAKATTEVKKPKK